MERWQEGQSSVPPLPATPTPHAPQEVNSFEQPRGRVDGVLGELPTNADVPHSPASHQQHEANLDRENGEVCDRKRRNFVFTHAHQDTLFSVPPRESTAFEVREIGGSQGAKVDFSKFDFVFGGSNSSPVQHDYSFTAGPAPQASVPSANTNLGRRGSKPSTHPCCPAPQVHDPSPSSLSPGWWKGKGRAMDAYVSPPDNEHALGPGTQLPYRLKNVTDMLLPGEGSSNQKHAATGLDDIFVFRGTEERDPGPAPMLEMGQEMPREPQSGSETLLDAMQEDAEILAETVKPNEGDSSFHSYASRDIKLELFQAQAMAQEERFHERSRVDVEMRDTCTCREVKAVGEWQWRGYVSGHHRISVDEYCLWAFAIEDEERRGLGYVTWD